MIAVRADRFEALVGAGLRATCARSSASMTRIGRCKSQLVEESGLTQRERSRSMELWNTAFPDTGAESSCRTFTLSGR